LSSAQRAALLVEHGLNALVEELVEAAGIER
jgi:hypothetical protein